jgi:hypothetical protein
MVARKVCLKAWEKSANHFCADDSNSAVELQEYKVATNKPSTEYKKGIATATIPELWKNYNVNTTVTV